MGIAALTEASEPRPHAKCRLFALTLGSILLAWPASAPAADKTSPAPNDTPLSRSPVDEARLQARRVLLERAKERYEAGRGTGQEARQQLEGALDALRLAYQIAPASWMLFNLAQVKSRLGACSEAAELYQHFLASDPAPAARTSAEEALKLLGTCGSAEEPSTDPSLPPSLRLPSGRSLLADLDGAAAPSTLLTPGPEAATEVGGFRGWPWIFGGLAVTSAIAGALFYGEAVEAKHDLDQLRVGGPLVGQTQERGESAQAAARVFGGFAVGFALAAGASLWTMSEPAEAPVGASIALDRRRGRPIGASASYSFEF